MKNILWFILVMNVVSCAKKDSPSASFKGMFSVWSNSKGTFDFTFGKLGYSANVTGQYKSNNCNYKLQINGTDTVVKMTYTQGFPSATCPDFYYDLTDDGTSLLSCYTDNTTKGLCETYN